MVNGTSDKKPAKPTPDQDWLTAVLGQLTSFIPIPPKGIAPLSVPAGPHSHGRHPPDNGQPTDKPVSPPSDGADSPYYTGVDEDERSKKIPVRGTFTDEMEFPDMTRYEMEKYFGFDRTKLEKNSKARRGRRNMIPLGGARKYLI